MLLNNATILLKCYTSTLKPVVVCKIGNDVQNYGRQNKIYDYTKGIIKLRNTYEQKHP